MCIRDRIRDWRLGKIAGDPGDLLRSRIIRKGRDKQDAGSRDGLTELLLTLVDDYREKHPDLTFDDVEGAVQDCLSIMFWVEEKSKTTLKRRLYNLS